MCCNLIKLYIILLFQEKPYKNWFLEMISYPCQKQLSMLESFTAISASAVYLPLNLFLLLYPVQSCVSSVNDNIQTFEQCTQAKGFIRLVGIEVCCIFFLYVIFSRASSRLPATGIILGTLLSRTIYAISAGYLLYVRKYIAISVLYNIMTIDCGLAFASVGIWLFQPGDGTSKTTFFTTIWQLVRPSNSLVHKSSIVVHILGFIQSILSLLCFICPALAFHILKIDARELYNNLSMGYYSMGLMASAATGFIHVLSGGADSRSFNFAAVFYRVFFTIPLITYVGVVGQVPFGLSLYYIILDGFFAVAVFIALCNDYKKVKTKY